MVKKQKNKIIAEKLYLILAGIFVASLVTCNLIANKFVTLDLGFKTFIVSAGILPYPLTFLVTDILSEIYGKKRASMVVLSGFIASLFVLIFLWLGGQFNAINSSPLDNETYSLVFNNAWRVIFASMIAYLSAQFLDVRLFHFWKNMTNGRHLWLRNNASTIGSQLLDTILVISVLFVGVWESSQIISAIIDGWLFKMLIAFIDTPLFYLISSYLRRLFDLQLGEELKS
jgi:hypothetical protein